MSQSSTGLSRIAPVGAQRFGLPELRRVPVIALKLEIIEPRPHPQVPTTVRRLLLLYPP